MTKANLLPGLVAALLFTSAVAQDDAPDARRVTVSLQTGTPVAAETVAAEKAGINRAEPIAHKARGNQLIAATVVSVEPVSERTLRVRHIDYSEDQIVVIGLAADGSELTRSVMTDPRMIRAEALLGENDLSETRLYRQSVDFSFAVDDPAVVRVRIAKPRWNGSSWLFESIAEAPL